MITRRQLGGAGLALAAASLVPSALAGEDPAKFPSRAIRVIFPFSVGTGGDLLARAIAQKVSEATGQMVLVDNRVGAGGAIGTIAVAKAEPDGYTILMGASPFATAAGMDPKVGYDPVKDFTPVTKVVTAPLLFGVSAKLPVQNLQELVAHARANPDKLAFGSSGTGSSAHIETELLKLATGAPMTGVAYKETSQLLSDLFEGRIAMYAGIASVLLPHIQSGKIRAVAVIDSRRSPLLPDVPTVAEALNQPDYVATPNWYGVLAPAGTPPAIVARLSDLIRDALGSPQVTQVIERFGGQRYTPTNAVFTQELQAEVARVAGVARRMAAAGK